MGRGFKPADSGFFEPPPLGEEADGPPHSAMVCKPYRSRNLSERIKEILVTD